MNIPRAPAITNEDVAAALDRIADLLEVQDANPFRVRAYRNGADALRTFDFSVPELALAGGSESLVALPHIGAGLAHLIESFARSGRLELLDRLEGQMCPEDLFRSIPGLGPVLAGRIHRELDIDTLEELEVAAHDGRLAGLEGFGPRRVRLIRETLAGVLGRASRRRSLRYPIRPAADNAAQPSEDRTGELGASDPPSVATLLQIDAEYRAGCDRGTLPRIAPRRFNPKGERWLPILHTEHGGRPFTALFSNTARAHEFGKTHDWVVIYADGSEPPERYTVVTEHSGPSAGLRVVRGREVECAMLRDRTARASDTVSRRATASAGRTRACP